MGGCATKGLRLRQGARRIDRGARKPRTVVTEPTYSFVCDRKTAEAAFPGIAIRDLVLSLLAGISPEKEWEGCLVYEGDSPLEAGTACIGTSGPGADGLQLRLLDALERQGVVVNEVFEGGPAVKWRIASAGNGQWVDPGPADHVGG